MPVSDQTPQYPAPVMAVSATVPKHGCVPSGVAGPGDHSPSASRYSVVPVPCTQPRMFDPLASRPSVSHVLPGTDVKVIVEKSVRVPETYFESLKVIVPVDVI